MSIEAVRKLRTTWQANAGLQRALETAFDRIGFDSEYIQNCINTVQTGSAPRKAKHVKDNVWGMIEVNWPSVRLLDCPVIQRLRAIKQNGLSYITYPTAEHSRFSHSLGMACVVSRFIESINRRAREDGADTRISDDQYVACDRLAPLTAEDIIHAAILHDVGHMPFSHATEKILDGEPQLFLCGNLSVDDLRASIGKCLKKSIHLAEALSLLVILSKRFSGFYDRFVRHGSEDPDAILRIAALVAGLPPEARLSGVSELISAAAVDADKVDYVNRDALACGIPVGIDVSRIFLRSGFIQATRERLLKARLKDDPAPIEILFVINASGMDTVDEITQARAALYQRVYLHSVTRTAEEMLARALVANATSKKKVPALADALQLWATGDDTLLNQLATSADKIVRQLGRRLRNRRLPKKACVFSASVAQMHMPLEALFPNLPPTEIATFKKQIAHTPLEGLTSAKVTSGVGRMLEDRIQKETSALAALLLSHGRRDLVPKKPLDLIAVIGTAYMDRVRKDCIVLQNGDLLRTSQFTNVREQQDAFDIFKAVGFVMTDAEWRPLVLLASRTVLCEPISDPQPTILTGIVGGAEGDKLAKHSIKLSFLPRSILDLSSVIRRSGVNRQKVTAVLEAATDAGYFDDKPLLAENTDPGSAAITKVTTRLEKFEGQRSWRIKNEVVSAFVDQFPPHLRQSLLSALSRVVFFDKAELCNSLLMHISKIPGQFDICSLSPNSGNFVRNALEDETKSQHTKYFRYRRDLHEALAAESSDPLVLVDDNISSATQARAQFLSWANIPRAKWPIECRDEDGIFSEPLSSDELRRMKSRPLYIVVCAGRKSAGHALRPVLRNLGFTSFKGVFYKHEIGRHVGWPTELRKFLTDVGYSLMAWSRFGKEPSRLTSSERRYCEDRAFGYGNVGGLVATVWNVPTATATAFWSPGMFNGSPWMPLVVRRNKLRHLILA